MSGGPSRPQSKLMIDGIRCRLSTSPSKVTISCPRARKWLKEAQPFKLNRAVISSSSERNSFMSGGAHRTAMVSVGPHGSIFVIATIAPTSRERLSPGTEATESLLIKQIQSLWQQCRMITYSVFRLAARRTVLCGWILRAGMRAGERKTGWTKPLLRSPGLWALNAPGLLLVGHRGIPGGGVERFAVPTRLWSGQHSLDLTIWPSHRNADGARGASVSAPAGGRFGFAWLKRRSWVMMCPEPAGGRWAA
jgi:hypothetical protein